MTSGSACHHTVPWGGFYIRIYVTHVVLGLLSFCFFLDSLSLKMLKVKNLQAVFFSAWFYEMLYLLDLFVSAGSRAWVSADI